jgi:hypothetical protein
MCAMPSWRAVVTIASALPEVEETTWYNTPALKVAGKGFARLRVEAEGGLVLMCSLEDKEQLLASGEPYFTTPHYDGHGSILVDLDLIDRAALEKLIVNAWRIKAPARLRRAFDESRAPTTGRISKAKAHDPAQPARRLRRAPLPESG